MGLTEVVTHLTDRQPVTAGSASHRSRPVPQSTAAGGLIPLGLR